AIQADQDAPTGHLDAGVLFDGGGTVTLTSTSNNYRGGTEISSGILQVSADSNLGHSAGAITFNDGGTLATTDSFTSSRNIVFSGSGALSPSADTTLSLSGTNSGAGGLTINGPGTVLFSNNQSYTGDTTISGGTLAFSGCGALNATTTVSLAPDAILDITNAHIFSTIGNLSGTGGTVALGGHRLYAAGSGNSTFSGTISDNGSGTLVKQGGGTLTLAGTNTASGTLTIDAGAIETTGSSAGAWSNITVGTTLNLNHDTDVTLVSWLSGAGTINALGTGKVNFTGENEIFSGTLNLQGPVAINNLFGGHVAVAPGGTLSGTGHVLGSVTVGSGGVSAPGNSIGTMVISGNYTQAADSTYLVQINNAGDSTLLDIGGSAI
ncbi:MAG: autotransporter-associated beta strand repeat-containing protein, partial [Pseudomonadota bacterium]